jgi:DNA-binding NarL/FixJ family response regulator
VGELDQNEPGASLVLQAGKPREVEARENGARRAGSAQLQVVASLRPQKVTAVFLGRGGLFQEGLTSILSDTDFRIVTSVCEADEVELTPAPDERVLLIVDAGDDLNRAAAEIERFKAKFPVARVAVLTDADQISNLLTLFRAGAHACFARGVTRDVLLKSLELVVLGETFLLPGILPLVHEPREARAALPSAPNRAASLSAQEKCVLRCLAEGHSNKVIANKIDIAVATVKVHVNSIFRKIGTSNRTQAAIWARNNIAQEEPGEDRAALPAPAPAPGAPCARSVEVPPVATLVDATSASPDTAPERPCEMLAAQTVKEKPIRSAQAEKSACGSKQEPLGKAGTRRCSLEEELERRAQRRLAEQEERHAEFVAKTNHLRELRKAREAAERKGPAPMPSLLPLKPSSAGADDRGSQNPGIRLA